MKHKNSGFSMFLTFLVSSVIFLLVGAGENIARLSMNAGRTDMLDCLSFHAADGGLEKGIAKLRKEFNEFKIKYEEKQVGSRIVTVEVSASISENSMDLTSEASVYEAGRLLTKKTLKRSGIEKGTGRQNIGLFAEVK